MTLHSELDHLVVAARSLDEGVAWCRETLGFEPTAGGVHPLMGTHNRVVRVASAAFPRSYLEIIAIDPSEPAPAHARWFDLDAGPMRDTIARGPRLIHFVARTRDVASAVASLRRLDIERGPPIAAERATPAGLLRWKITVRSDGARLFDGALPTLIEWDSPHPADSLADCAVALQTLEVTHPQAQLLQGAYESIGLVGVRAVEGPPNIAAVLDCPRGRIRLESAGL